MTIANDLAVFSGGAGGVNTGGFMRNRIINGAMVVDQRNAGASVTPTASVYTLDRWYAYASQSSKYSVQQNAGSVTPPTGFTKYLGATSLSAYSVGATDYFGISQKIEGFNVSDFGWGSASAKTVTLSFQVYSSLTGTFGGVVRNGTPNRYYPFSYSIGSANTWTSISITIAGDTTGTWATDNTTGIEVFWGLGVGSTYSGTAGSWGGTTYLSVTGATSVVGTNGATFYITGVQLEVGSVATPFERRLYGQELLLCQRYHQGGGTQTAAAIQAGNYKTVWFAPLTITTGQAIRIVLPMKTSMRSTPTVTYEDNNGNIGKCYFNGTNATIANYNATSETVIAVATAPGNSSSVDMWVNYVLDSEL